MLKPHSFRKIRIAFVIVAITISYSAYSWSLIGHRVVGEIAQNHLSRQAKRELKKIIGKETLAWWSNWADFIKSDSNWNHASPWHYVDLPGHIGKEEFIRDMKKLPGENLYTQIKAMTARLKDKSLSIEKRRIALAFLVHLIGDLHQPLHVGREEDQGGNKIIVYWFNEKTNLHSVWDSYFIESQKYSYTEYSSLLDIASPEQVRNWQAGTLEDWLYESHVLSDTIYDATPNESKLSYNYNYKFQNLLNQQLLKGGLRLAAILNDVLQ